MVTIDFRQMLPMDNGPATKAYKFRLMTFVKSHLILDHRHA